MSLFGNLEYLAPDEFNDIRLKLANDDSDCKIDISAGVYRDEKGKPYVLPSIRKAKDLLHLSKEGHDYNLCLGIPDFVQCAARIAVGESAMKEGKVASCQTIGGTGACHLGSAFLAQYCGFKNFYLGIPAWPNYIPLIEQAGGKIITYNYYDPEKKTVDFSSLVDAMNCAPKNSVFILQLCCHNPTGTDLTREQWATLASIMKIRGLIPFIDGAYQGLASGSLEEDAWPVRMLINTGLDILFCQSFSKSLGLYGERVGCLHIVSQNPTFTDVVRDTIRYIFRAECSSSPAFGARLVSQVSNSPELMSQWNDDLEKIFCRLNTIRQMVYDTLTTKYETPGNWEFIKTQKGLFWFSGLGPEQVKKMIEEFHIYLPRNGRINIAGLNDNNVQLFCSIFDRIIKN
ncbi:uncharacterized protein PRCAT00004285001 [Priceomyces carsonii]|uniref:uncharacterized protein n=1 Tax=Priceomyces carsonii TaxID=28549 RepID=UPI002ED9CDF1|nr:unnamed protein product [Priceomyces carsonii]